MTSGKLKFIHNLPRTLVTADAQVAQRDPAYVKSFASTLQPIMKEHEAACRARQMSNPLCGNCGSPAVNINYFSSCTEVEDIGLFGFTAKQEPQAHVS